MVHSPDFRFSRLPQVPPGKFQAEPGVPAPTLVDMESSTPLPDLPGGPGPAWFTWDDTARGLPALEFPPGSHTVSMFWLNGDVLMCACPDCRAPMTVRLWLLLADCWQCEACVELTEEQEREAQRVLERHQAHAQRAPAASTERVAEKAHARAAVSTGPRASRAVLAPPSAPAARQPQITHEPAAPPHSATPQSPSARRRPRRTRINWLHAFLRNMPAWLISLLFHVILLTILGLLTEPEEDGPYITLSTRVHALVRDGGTTRIVPPTDTAVYDLGVPDSVNLEDPAQRRALARADQDAREAASGGSRQSTRAGSDEGPAAARQCLARAADIGGAGPAAARGDGAAGRGHDLDRGRRGPRAAMVGAAPEP